MTSRESESGSPEKSPLKKLRALTSLPSLRKPPQRECAGGSQSHQRKVVIVDGRKITSNNVRVEGNGGTSNGGNKSSGGSSSKIKPPSTLKYKGKSHIKADSPTYDMLSKPVYSSNLFKDIPVRQRKGGAVSHLENYCLFDPSVDFFNEKEHILRSIPETKVLEFATEPHPPPPLIYDTLEEIDETEELLFESSSSDSTTSTGKLQKSISSSAIDRRSTSSSSTSSYYGVVAVRKLLPSSLPNSPAMYQRHRKMTHVTHVMQQQKFPLKPSSSLPQLYTDRLKHLRRPLSNYSADSGFLSPQSPTRGVTFDETQQLIQVRRKFIRPQLLVFQLL